MAIVEYAGSMVECSSTDGFPVYPDGWFLKHTDTGEQYFHRAGNWEPLGLGFSFAPPTKSLDAITDDYGKATIVFDEPFADNNYTVNLTCYRPINKLTPSALLLEDEKTKEGFSFITVDYKNKAMRRIRVTWVATKHHP